MHAVAIHQQDRSERTRPLLFYYLAQGIEDLFQGQPSGDHLDEVFLSPKQSVGALSFADVANQGEAEFSAVCLKKSRPDLRWENSSVLSTVMSLERHDFSCVNPLTDSLETCRICICIESRRLHS